MALRERLDADIKAAMLAKDPKLGALRMIKAAVRNKEIDMKKTLDDTEVISICASLKKQWEDALAQAKAGGRADPAQEAEIAVLQSFLPAALSDAELDQLIAQAISTVGATGPKDMGKVMKALTDQTKGRADGKVVSERVKAKLGGQ